MKKLISILSTSILLVFLTSCSNEEIEDFDNTSLEGLWKLTALTLSTPLDVNNNGISNSNLLEEVSIIDATLVLGSNGNGTIFYDSRVSFNTKLENGASFFTIASSKSSDDKPLAITYSIDNDVVVINEDITFNGLNGEVSILTLRDGKLIMDVPNGFVVKDIDTLLESISQDVSYTFSRQ